jgi:hypothetical protein
MANLAGLCLLLACAPGAAQPVAILTEVQGSCRIESGGRAAPAEPMSPVQAGSVLVLAPYARVVLAYMEGGWIFELRGDGRFLARTGDVQARDGHGTVRRRNLAAALRALTVRADGPTVQGSVSMRGKASLLLRARGPAGSHLRDEALSVCWNPLGAGWHYRLRLIDADGQVVSEQQTVATQLALPAPPPAPAAVSWVWHLAAFGTHGREAEQAGRFRWVDGPTELALVDARSVARAGDATDRAIVSIARLQLGFDADAGEPCPPEAHD